MIIINVETRQSTVEQTEIITTGSVGIQCSFGFSSDWDGLTRVAVFRVGDNEDWYDTILDDTNVCSIPWELLTVENEGEPVFVGAEGTDPVNGSIVIPTVWASVGAIKPGAHSGNASGADPTPSQWSQILSLAESAAADAESAQQSAETAEGYAEHGPVITDDYWYTWNGTQYETTGQKAKGDTGDDGFSPVIATSAITGGHSVSITDSTHTEIFNVTDGQDGQDGAVGPAGIAVQEDEPTTGVLAWFDTDGGSTRTLAEMSDLSPINSAISGLKSDLGIVEDGDTATHNISAGQYVIWKGALYKASAAITSGAALSSSNLDNTYTQQGGFNDLKNTITPSTGTATLNTTNINSGTVKYQKFGRIVVVNVNSVITKIRLNGNNEVATGLPNAYMDYQIVLGNVVTHNPVRLEITATGELKTLYDTLEANDQIFGTVTYFSAS